LLKQFSQASERGGYWEECGSVNPTPLEAHQILQLRPFDEPSEG